MESTTGARASLFGYGTKARSQAKSGTDHTIFFTVVRRPVQTPNSATQAKGTTR